MRLQLTRTLAIAWLLLGALPARADDKVDTTVTWFQERRQGGSLTILHPQIDLGFDLGSHVSVATGYEADVVSGATPGIYAAATPGQSVDAVSNASHFEDVRHAVHGQLGFRGKRSGLDVGYAFGIERDYRSHAVSATGNVDLPGKNTNFAIAYTRNFDSVCDFANGDASPLERRPLSGADPCFTSGETTLTHDVDIDTAQGTVTQNLSPTAVLQLGVYGQIVRGFQSNPYRRVRVSGFDAQENVPRVRDRAALFGRLKLAFPSLHAAAGLVVRGYADTWGVRSGTAEVDYHQYLGKALLVRLRARYYQQTGAVFFRDALEYATSGPAGAYFTGDRELAPLRTVLAGARLSYVKTAEEGRAIWGLFDEADVHLKGEGIWSMPLTETAPGGDVGGPLPDAIVAQLALLLRY